MGIQGSQADDEDTLQKGDYNNYTSPYSAFHHTHVYYTCMHRETLKR